MYQTILWEVRDHTGVLTLNRPERLNAVDNVMRKELEAVLRKAEADPDVWTIIATGNGRGFCSGADLKARAEAEKRGEGASLPPLFEPRYYYAIAFSELSKPVIAAVNGVTRGAGCNMVFAADFRIASEQANFGVNFVERGLMGETAAYYLPRLVGQAVAAEICLLGEPFDAAQAKAYGLLNAVVPHEKLMEEAMALARRLNSKAPIAVRMTKIALRRAYDCGAEQFLDMQNAMNNKLRTTADTREAMRAFLEKRSPEFRGE
ncbi:MAG TPA: enoyl-CoA hydratase/isomerase family protein [Burkholderiales bacterium]|nr:enoyl-CoA hydratase/isomerase family protein [Burkholderiales bacterium]